MMQQYSIDKRPYTFHSSIAEELAIDRQKSYLCPMDHLTCLSVMGDQGEKFLQGQFSCDVSKVDDKNFVEGALCNLQGRVKLLANIVHCHDYQIILPADLLEVCQQDLKTVAMLSRVKLHHSDNYRIFAIVGNIEDDFIPAAFRLPPGQTAQMDEFSCVYRLCDSVLIVLVHKKDMNEIVEYYRSRDRLKGSLLCHYLALQEKKFHIYPSTSAHFLPHKISLHELGYLSFDKGCYKGQEIIARMHYRGKIKQQLRLLECESTDRIYPAQALLSENRKIIGEIVDYCPLSETRFLVAASVNTEYEGAIEPA